MCIAVCYSTTLRWYLACYARLISVDDEPCEISGIGIPWLAKVIYLKQLLLSDLFLLQPESSLTRSALWVEIDFHIWFSPNESLPLYLGQDTAADLRPRRLQIYMFHMVIFPFASVSISSLFKSLRIILCVRRCLLRSVACRLWQQQICTYLFFYFLAGLPELWKMSRRASMYQHNVAWHGHWPLAAKAGGQ